MIKLCGELIPQPLQDRSAKSPRDLFIWKEHEARNSKTKDIPCYTFLSLSMLKVQVESPQIGVRLETVWRIRIPSLPFITHLNPRQTCSKLSLSANIEQD